MAASYKKEKERIMKKTVILTLSLVMSLAALPAKAQTVGTQEQNNNYLIDIRNAQAERHAEQAEALIQAAKAGDETRVWKLIFWNHYTIQEYIAAFDATPNQHILDYIYTQALKRMRLDAFKGFVGTPGIWGYNAYAVDYTKYYPKNSPEYNKGTVQVPADSELAASGIGDTKIEATKLIKPILNYLLGEERVKKVSKDLLLNYDGTGDASAYLKTEPLPMFTAPDKDRNKIKAVAAKAEADGQSVMKS